MTKLKARCINTSLCDEIMIHGFATIKFLFLPEQHALVQRHAQESSMLGGQHHAQGEHHARRGGQLAWEQQAHIAQGEQYAGGSRILRGSSIPGGESYMLGKQYAWGSSIIGLYIASLHEIEDNLRNNSTYCQQNSLQLLL